MIVAGMDVQYFRPHFAFVWINIIKILSNIDKNQVGEWQEW